ncbi:hypothetical protein RDI58_017910 [Solanum bulbocastanum]|uniref:RNase H type-1 domain-containing protein n=1 Tax=Solanum bulbocastanum TaxID=147425 RepID=A0AAN8TC51_SOLBU
MAFSKAVHCTNNNQTEAIAATFGVNWCVEKGINCFMIEMDFLVITNMLKNMSTTNLKLKKIIYDTYKSVSNVNINFIHCYRKANMVAD